ncbi:hypothetical protein [Desulfosporosinus hippei]|uniref:hypothetical protein n=1 Tax=Desulfosporosinus hippei TaxID=569859 RepID=UPI000B8161FE|nr:hypothetical protein [Desulfosporosinus hippei]
MSLSQLPYFELLTPPPLNTDQTLFLIQIIPCSLMAMITMTLIILPATTADVILQVGVTPEGAIQEGVAEETNADLSVLS